MDAPLKVLLVEDSEDDALLLLRELRRGGYEPLCERVDTAAAMEAALEERTWDIVISDHSMPAFSSSAALELLRAKGFVDMPFIIVSGQIGEDVAVAAMKAGAHDYIMKDNLARLNTAIERELREAEGRRERRRAEEKYRSIFENSVEGIFQTTVEGRFVTANPALARMFGYDSPEQLLENISDVGEKLYVDPERRAEFDRLIRRDGFVSGFEIQMYRTDGSVMWASASVRAVRDAEGAVIAFEGTARDPGCRASPNRPRTARRRSAGSHLRSAVHAGRPEDAGCRCRRRRGRPAGRGAQEGGGGAARRYLRPAAGERSGATAGPLARDHRRAEPPDGPRARVGAGRGGEVPGLALGAGGYGGGARRPGGAGQRPAPLRGPARHGYPRDGGRRGLGGGRG